MQQELISPTDFVKDRLAAYYFWEDQQSLAQAILTSIHNRINISEIKRWSQADGKIEGFKIFLERYDGYDGEKKAISDKSFLIGKPA